MPQVEYHRSERIGWLRAAVLGANDGIVSTASLLLGVAAHRAARMSAGRGVAGLVAGPCRWPRANTSLSARRPTPSAPTSSATSRSWPPTSRHEHEELAASTSRGASTRRWRRKLPIELMAHDALARTRATNWASPRSQRPRPVQAALASAATFWVRAAMPPPPVLLPPRSTAASWSRRPPLLFLDPRRAGRPSGRRDRRHGRRRVTFWGALAMAAYGRGGRAFFGAVV